MVVVSNWMHVDVFTVDQACALWCGFDPAGFGIFNDQYPSEMEAVKQLIVGGIVSGQIISDSTRNVFHSIGDYSKTYVTREQLEKFARKKQLFPDFLFNTLAPFTRGKPTGLLSGALYTPVAQVSLPETTNRGGRPSEYDWDSFMLEIIRRANSLDGLPDSQAELVRDMLQWFSITTGLEPAESSIKVRTSKIYKYLNESKGKVNKPGD